MRYIKTDIEGVYILEPNVFTDERGYFYESFVKKNFSETIKGVDFVQENESKSKRGVIRGLHLQFGEHAQSKLVRVARGAVIDVAVDLRPESLTFGKHVAVELSEYNNRQLFIPKGFAHGFVVVSKKNATLQYKCDSYYDPESEVIIDPLDEDLSINWGLDESEMTIKDKDRKGLSFMEYIEKYISNGEKITGVLTRYNEKLPETEVEVKYLNGDKHLGFLKRKHDKFVIGSMIECNDITEVEAIISHGKLLLDEVSRVFYYPPQLVLYTEFDNIYPIVLKCETEKELRKIAENLKKVLKINGQK